MASKRANRRDKPVAPAEAAVRRRQRREWRRAFRIMTVGAAGFSVLLAVGVTPEVLYRDGDPLSALLLAASPLLIVGALRLIWGLIQYSHR